MKESEVTKYRKEITNVAISRAKVLDTIHITEILA